ncbi:uncharacterized protein [Nicotiana tomentosiformis]|uniref:uncharacterized protein n=1 Tax=Nicotiana tomentosiformis TaxID=4098 RepID=UPI00388C6658
MGSLAYISVGERPLAADVQTLANQFMRLDVSVPSQVLACTVARSSLYEHIRERQYDDPHLLVLKDTVWHVDTKHVAVGEDGVLRMQGRICVPNMDGLRELILEEAHSSRYSVHPEEQLRSLYKCGELTGTVCKVTGANLFHQLFLGL